MADARSPSPALAPAPTRKVPGPARGVVHGGTPQGTVQHHRALPASDLAPFVAHFWWVQWSLTAPFRVETLPHPTVHIMVEGGTCGPRAVVQGVPTKRFVRQLQGEGFVFGIKFRPAVFPSWLGWSRAQSLSQSISKLTDKHITLLRLFGREGRVFSAAVLAASSMEARMGLAEAFLRGHGPPRSLSLSAAVAELRDLVERMATEHSLLRADDAALRLGIDLRTLQRRFQKHVGVGPKWVLQRYRLHEAVERLKQPHPPAMADLAASLGYFDQAHFARELKAMVGRAPKAFVAQLTRAAR